MPVHNVDIAAIFEQIADLLEIEDANPFRVRAYRRAARSVGECGVELSALVRRGEALPKIPGVGTDLSAKIKEIAATGDCALLQRLRREVPPAVAELLTIPGLGPRRVRTLYHELAVTTPQQLLDAARRGAIRDLPGFGAKTEAKILAAAAHHARQDQRVLRAAAQPHADSLLDYLRGVPGVERADVAGSYRRGRDTVGDLDIVVCAPESADVGFALTAYEDVVEVLAQGPTRSSVVLRNGLQVDLRVVERAAYGAALLYFTGSKAHGIALRRMAQARGLKINEYGLYRGARRLAGAAEADMYAALKLPYIEPELREDRGELEAARAGHLPRLVTLAELRGDLHLHTAASDGHHSVRDMALAAKALGLRYIAVTDHSQRLTMARGLDAARLQRQMDEIDALQRGEKLGITVLKGAEVDILKDGSLDLPDALLMRLDVVIGAVHSHFDLSRAEQTARLLRALEHPALHLLAHPQGRLIGQRDGCDFDWDALLRKAVACGCALELNAQPERLDLTDTRCRDARAAGVPVCINSDAHSVDGLRDLQYGISQARRGWLEAGDVLNTRPLPALRKWLTQKRRKAARE